MIAIGVPTVVDAVSITSDAIDYLLKHFGREMREEIVLRVHWRPQV